MESEERGCDGIETILTPGGAEDRDTARHREWFRARVGQVGGTSIVGQESTVAITRAHPARTPHRSCGLRRSSISRWPPSRAGLQPYRPARGPDDLDLDSRDQLDGRVQPIDERLESLASGKFRLGSLRLDMFRRTALETVEELAAVRTGSRSAELGNRPSRSKCRLQAIGRSCPAPRRCNRLRVCAGRPSTCSCPRSGRSPSSSAAQSNIGAAYADVRTDPSAGSNAPVPKDASLL